MGLKTLHATLTGIRPLLLHNGQLADPTNEHTKALREVTSKRKKTDADHIEIKRLEWLGCLYRDEQGQVAVSEDMLLGCVSAGARAAKKGKQAQAALLGAQPFFALKYKGPTDLTELFNTGKFCDYRLVVIDRKRIMRARPRFNQWGLDAELLYDDSLLNRDDVVTALTVAGATVGMGDFRPRFGRFTVEVS
jgi:hypothetical protein